MKARLTILLAVAVVVAIAGVAAGCGSDSGGGSSSDATSQGSGSGSNDKETFVKEATAVCEQGRAGALERAEVYQAKYKSEGFPESEGSEKALKVVVLETVEGELEGLRKLEPPAGEEQQVEALLTAIATDLEAAKNKAPKSSSGEVEGSFAKSSRELVRYGIPGCAK